MAISDYNTDPDLNTTISGINIAEGCPPSGINNAIRQLMADVKTQVDTDGTTYLPLAGGTMTGNIAFPAQSAITNQLQFKNGDGTLNGSVNAFGNEMGIGWAYGSGHGAGLALRSKDYPGNGGGWDLIAKAGGTDVSLSGKTNGSLKWNGKEVEAVDSSGTEWVRYTSGIQICWGGANAKQTNNFPKAFTAAPAITVTHVMGSPSGGCFYHGVYATATTFYIKDFDDGTGYSRYIAIGRWK